MRTQKVFIRSLASLILISLMLFPTVTNAYPGGIGGQEVWAEGDIDDVAKEGCLCHAAEPSNSVMIILDDVPYSWAAGESYDMRMEIVGGQNHPAEVFLPELVRENYQEMVKIGKATLWLELIPTPIPEFTR